MLGIVVLIGGFNVFRFLLYTKEQILLVLAVSSSEPALPTLMATGTHLTLGQRMTIFAVAVLTSKGASGVQGASFIALVGTLSVVSSVPVAGMALILGIDRFMSMFRASVNMIGNGVATLVIARWEKEIDKATLQHHLQSSNE